MKRHEPDDGEGYVVIEERSTDVGVFLFGVLLGAGVALLVAPRSGAETRDVLRRRARSAREAARHAAEGVAERVADGLGEARDELERRIEAARAAVSARTRQLADAVEAGRLAAREARAEVGDQVVDRQKGHRARPQGSAPGPRSAGATEPLGGRSRGGPRKEANLGDRSGAGRAPEAPGPLEA